MYHLENQAIPLRFGGYHQKNPAQLLHFDAPTLGHDRDNILDMNYQKLDSYYPTTAFHFSQSTRRVIYLSKTSHRLLNLWQHNNIYHLKNINLNGLQIKFS